MRIRSTGRDLSEQRADLAACFAHEGDREPRGIGDPQLRRELAVQMRAEAFKGKAGDQLIWNADGRYASRRFLVLGLGPEGKAPGESLRSGCARAARLAGTYSAKSMALQLPLADEPRANLEARAATEGAMLGAYQFDRYLTDSARRQVRLETVELATTRSGARRAVELGEIGGRAVWLGRDLVNEGPSALTPPVLARLAMKHARAAGIVSRTLGPAQLRKLGMGGLLAVARGSSEPPQVVHLVYRPAKGKPKRRIALIGKGVTFDSGGLNLKPGDSMLTMKCDMAGAAAVLATMLSLPEVGCRAEVHALLGLVENMTGAGAYKPGDILRTWSGKTVEVGNTDAEGRLVLCDLLAYAAAKFAPTEIVDIATLTGACVVALGTKATGLFTRHDELGRALIEAGTLAGEKIWQLPLYDEYLELLQTGPADLRNVGGRWGGAITGALFLGEFVPRQLPWAHLDIAGPAFTERDQPETPLGATGAGILTLLRWLERVSS